MTAWLLTWFWQGSALAAGVAGALRCAPRRNAATRHVIWCATLAAVAWLGWASLPYGAPPAELSSGADPIYVPSAPVFLLNIFVGIWAAIALVSLVRLLPGIRAVYALRDRCRPFPPAIESRLPLWLEENACGRRATLMICDDVPGATVLGFHGPCIAIPSALVDALSVDELDQVILHEHAHVQRRDDWARLAETLLLSALWIHPAALFVSRALNREREMACDEWVVARTGSAKAYARCLAHAAEVRSRMRGGPALIPTLIGSRHDLLRRVDRVLAINGRARRRVSLAGAAMAAFAMVMTSAQLQTMRGFSEIVEIVFPIDHVQEVQGVQWVLQVHGVRGPLSMQPAPQTRKSVPSATLAPDAPVAQDSAPLASAFALDAQIATADKPIAPDLSARTFAGAYPVPDAAVVPPAGQRNPWQALATPGVEIASSAKKISVGVASAFTRAGVSLARSF